MSGGTWHRKFYLSEIDRIDAQHRARLPETKYTVEEVQAGFDRLSSTFGFYGTLLYLEKETGHSRKELLTWSVYAFNYNIVYLAHQGATMKRYSEIMRNKK